MPGPNRVKEYGIFLVSIVGLFVTLFERMRETCLVKRNGSK